MTSRWEQIAHAESGPGYAEEYARRFAAGAARGDDVHGEASFVADLRPAPARVLDAGCGTGRVAVRLAELGHDVAGVDVDPSMLAVAARQAPHLAWGLADLATLGEQLVSIGLGVGWDVVLLAGNVVPLTEAGTLPAVAAGCADAAAPGGLVVAGFGLDEAHLPAGCPVTPLADWEAAAAAAGLVLVERYAGWDAGSRLERTEDPEGYAVVVHRRGGST